MSVVSTKPAKSRRPRAVVKSRPAERRRNARVRVGVIGLGYWGPNLVRNFRAVDDAEVRVCCDREASRTRDIVRHFAGMRTTAKAEAVLADDSIDAVVIATPVATHYELARTALESGKHVLVEKPLTADLAQAEELVRLAEDRGRVLMVDHVFLYSPAVRKIKEIVDGGQLGDLLFVDSVRINLGLLQHDVNVVWDLAPHDVSIVDHMVGRMPRSVAAFGASHTESDIEDVAYLNLDYGDGLIANFHLNWLSPVKIRYTMLGGSRKSLVYNDLDPVERIKVYDSGISVRPDDLERRRGMLVDYRVGDVWSPHVSRGEPLHVMAEHFVDCAARGKTPLSDGHAGLRVVRILDAAQRSIRAQGGRITL